MRFKFFISLAASLFVLTPLTAKTIEVEVKGLKCGVCASNIKTQLEKESVVASVEISLTKGLVTIATQKDGDLSDDKIKQIVTDSGQSVKTIRRL